MTRKQNGPKGLDTYIFLYELQKPKEDTYLTTTIQFTGVRKYNVQFLQKRFHTQLKNQ